LFFAPSSIQVFTPRICSAVNGTEKFGGGIGGNPARHSMVHTNTLLSASVGTTIRPSTKRDQSVKSNPASSLPLPWHDTHFNSNIGAISLEKLTLESGISLLSTSATVIESSLPNYIIADDTNNIK